MPSRQRNDVSPAALRQRETRRRRRQSMHLVTLEVSEHELAGLAAKGYRDPDLKIRLESFISDTVFDARDAEEHHFATRTHIPGVE